MKTAQFRASDTFNATGKQYLASCGDEIDA